jgi:hypothetical protein
MIRGQRNLTVRGAARQSNHERCVPKLFETKLFLKNRKNELTDAGTRPHNYAVACILLSPWD